MKKYVYSSCSLICNTGEYGPNCLFLGDAQAANNPKLLHSHKITTVLSIGQQSIPSHKHKSTKYYNLPLRDQHTQQANKYFQWAIEIIDTGRQTGNVYVHCYHGVSRSATFVIAYLMAKGNMGYQDAFRFVKERRGCVGPNRGFVEQLVQYEKEILGKGKEKSQQ